MGGPAGSGGSDKSDEKKVDTYSDQLKKEQARKSKTKKDKFGYEVKKNAVENFVDNDPRLQAVKNVSDKLNLNRRMNFANKNNISLQGLSTDEILSKDFKSQLDAKGYTRKDPRTGGNEGGDNPKSTEQPKTASQMDNTGVKSDLITADKTSPTTAEMSEDENMIDIKRRGRKTTTLTDKEENKKPTLSKKILLGY